MKLTTTQTYTEPQAKEEAAAILDEEANQLAGILDKAESLDRMNPTAIQHRVKIAILREIQRLRAISISLKP